MSDALMMQQQVRLGFRMSPLNGAEVGSVNTGIALWNGSPSAVIPTSRYPTSSWCTFTQSPTNSTDGTTFKFRRKGIYEVTTIMPMAVAATATMIGISLDCPAAQFLSGGITPTDALATMEDYDMATLSAGLTVSLRCRAFINITNALRGTDLSANGTPVGSMRIHVNGSTTVFINASCMMRVNDYAELFG